VQASTSKPEPRTMRTLWRRAGEILREGGPAGLLFLVLGDLGYRRVLILERRVEDAIAPIDSRTPVEFDELDVTEIDAYLGFYDGDTREEVEARFARGDTCYVARDAGQIVCSSWVARATQLIRFLDFRYEIPPSEVYLYDSYTAAGFRGRSVAPALGVYVLEDLRRLGVKRATLVVVPENTANRRARAKTGFRVCGRITRLRIAGRTWHWRSGAR